MRHWRQSWRVLLALKDVASKARWYEAVGGWDEAEPRKVLYRILLSRELEWHWRKLYQATSLALRTERGCCILGKLLGLLWWLSVLPDEDGTRSLMTWSRGWVEATTVLGGCLSQLRSELIELLSSSLQGHPQGHLRLLRRLPHQASPQQVVRKQMHPFCTISGFWQNHLHLQSRFEMLHFRCLPAQLIEVGEFSLG